MMSDQIEKVFGIDLGTTYSAISYVDENDKPVVITNAEGELITPSVVFFDDGGQNIIVGTAAKESAKMYPNDVVSFVKRSMGEAYYTFSHEDNEYTAEEISSYVLRKLVNDAKDKLNENIENVVITCPAYFGINEREATRRAGEIAGLNVLNIINEPTAAAFAYGLTDNNENKTILVYDLGGGTFDVTMIRIEDNKIEVIVTGGDHSLGGKDWDDAIIAYLVEQYYEQTGKDDDILLDPQTAQDLQIIAENAKKTLSTRSKAPISFIHGTDRVHVELTKEKFAELTAHLVERTINLTNAMLDDAKEKGVEGFDEILLVGGSTRMPQISEAISRAFNTSPNMYDPDESIAKGAALFGHQNIVQNKVYEMYNELVDDESKKLSLSGEKGAIDEELLDEATAKIAQEFNMTLGSVASSVKQEIVNVTSKSFGVVAHFSEADGEERVFNIVIKNDRVPAENKQSFGTHEDDQYNAKIRIMESETAEKIIELDEAEEIGEATLALPEGLPKNSPIEVTFQLNEEGRLEISAIERSEGRHVEATIETNSVISGEALEEAKQRSQGIVVS